jgi:hypothetical protein
VWQVGVGWSRAGVRARLSAIRGFVAARRSLRLTRVGRRCTHCSSSIFAHARIAMRTMIRPVPSRVPPPIT